jgi:uncharacterized membrane protein YcaP (DUF421 family)
VSRTFGPRIPERENGRPVLKVTAVVAPSFMTSLLHWLDQLLGLHVAPQDLGYTQIAGRSVVVFGFGVLLVRLADRRFLGRNAGFDVLLGVVLGSVLSRAINGQASFLPTLFGSALLVFLHRLLSTLAFHSHAIAWLVKGAARTLVRDGKVDTDELRGSKFSEEDLEENLRLNGNLARVAQVAEARLERNGQISVVPAKRSEPPAADQ